MCNVNTWVRCVSGPKGNYGQWLSCISYCNLIGLEKVCIYTYIQYIHTSIYFLYITISIIIIYVWKCLHTCVEVWMGVVAGKMPWCHRFIYLKFVTSTSLDCWVWYISKDKGLTSTHLGLWKNAHKQGSGSAKHRSSLIYLKVLALHTMYGSESRNM